MGERIFMGLSPTDRRNPSTPLYGRLINLKGDIDYLFSKGPKSSRRPKNEVIPSKLNFKFLPQ
jgi:hypothetical protein